MTRRRRMRESRVEEVEEETEEVEEESEVEDDEESDKPKRGRKASTSGIVLNDKWMINSDANQWKVNFKTGKDSWAPKVYLSSISGCLKWIVENEIRTSQYNSLKELADNIDNIKKEIGEFIKEQGLDPIW